MFYSLDFSVMSEEQMDAEPNDDDVCIVTLKVYRFDIEFLM